MKKVSLVRTMLVWVFASTFLASCLVGLASALLETRASNALVNDYREQARWYFADKMRHFDQMVFATLERLSSSRPLLGDLWAQTMPWCRKGPSTIPNSVAVLWEFLQLPWVHSITARYFYNNTFNYYQASGQHLQKNGSTHYLLCFDTHVWPWPLATVMPGNPLLAVNRNLTFFSSGAKFWKVLRLQAAGPQMQGVAFTPELGMSFNLMIPIADPLYDPAHGDSQYMMLSLFVDIEFLMRQWLQSSSSTPGGMPEPYALALVESENWEMVGIGGRKSSLTINNRTSAVQYQMDKLGDNVLATIQHEITRRYGGLQEIGNASIVIAVGSQTFLVDTVQWKHNAASKPISVILVMDKAQVFSLLVTQRWVIVLSVCLVALAMSLLPLPMAWKLVQPIQNISSKLRAVANLDFSGTPEELSPYDRSSTVFKEIDTLNKSYLELATALKAFSRYIPVSVCSNVVAGKMGTTLGVRPGDVTVMFADIVDFTSLFHEHDASVIVDSVAVCFDSMVNIITANKGTIDKFIGDAVMAFWNEPERVENHPVLATETAVACSKALREKRYQQGEDAIYLTMRFGLSTGPCLVGNFGAQDRFNFTVLGRYVNEAARLEPLGRLFGVDIIVSESLADVLERHGGFLLRKLRTCILRGFSQAVGVYQVFSYTPDSFSPETLHLIESYSRCLAMYEQAEFPCADELANQIISRHPEDIPSHLLAEDIETALHLPEALQSTWTPVKEFPTFDHPFRSILRN